jgi:hypothetical protein
LPRLASPRCPSAGFAAREVALPVVVDAASAPWHFLAVAVIASRRYLLGNNAILVRLSRHFCLERRINIALSIEKPSFEVAHKLRIVNSCQSMLHANSREIRSLFHSAAAGEPRT